jgi:hypothetical protein
MFGFLEGGHTFGLIYGLISGGLCLAVAIPLLYWVLPGRQRSFFGPRIDPRYRLQLAYGIFCMSMAFTDIGCRTIPHGELAYVHPTFFLMTIALLVALAPRVLTLTRSGKQLSANTL